MRAISIAILARANLLFGVFASPVPVATNDL
jgi:hypothetical protein